MRPAARSDASSTVSHISSVATIREAHGNNGEAPFQNAGVDPSLIEHRIPFKSDTIRNDIEFPRPVETYVNRDVSKSDWSTFVYDLGFGEKSAGNSEETNRLAHPTRPERRQKIKATIAEWNEIFFGPRLIRVIADFESRNSQHELGASSAIRGVSPYREPLTLRSSQSRQIPHAHLGATPYFPSTQPEQEDAISKPLRRRSSSTSSSSSSSSDSSVGSISSKDIEGVDMSQVVPSLNAFRQGPANKTDLRSWVRQFKSDLRSQRHDLSFKDRKDLKKNYKEQKKQVKKEIKSIVKAAKADRKADKKARRSERRCDRDGKRAERHAMRHANHGHHGHGRHEEHHSARRGRHQGHHQGQHQGHHQGHHPQTTWVTNQVYNVPYNIQTTGTVPTRPNYNDTPPTYPPNPSPQDPNPQYYPREKSPQPRSQEYLSAARARAIERAQSTKSPLPARQTPPKTYAVEAEARARARSLAQSTPSPLLPRQTPPATYAAEAEAPAAEAEARAAEAEARAISRASQAEERAALRAEEAEARAREAERRGAVRSEEGGVRGVEVERRAGERGGRRGGEVGVESE